MRPIIAALVLLMCAGCVTKPRLDAPPPREAAVPAGFSKLVRAHPFGKEFLEGRADEAIARTAASAVGSFDILALSGGGAGGAYGVGLLHGLLLAGQRPTYEIVTGVSSGALMAPFAFLGPSWDGQLKQAFMVEAAQSIPKPSKIGAAFNMLFGTGVIGGNPIRDLVERFATDDLIAAVASESAKGRRLLVGTTDLDRQETVVWNVGAIAQQGGPAARRLFIDVLVASASVPDVFPPVLIPVEVNGKQYEEMHVDGGASTPFIVLPDILNAVDFQSESLKGANIFVVFNSQLADPPHTTKVNTAAIAGRSFYTALNHLARAELLETAAFAERNAMRFRFTLIPYDYPFAGALEFDAASMNSLFAYGERCASEGKIWVTPQQIVARGNQGERAETAETTACPLAVDRSRTVLSPVPAP